MAANELGFTRARLSTVGAPRLTAPAPSVLAAPAASRMLIARLSVGQPDRIVWPKRRAVSARDGAVLAERVKSLIPVLPWQTGYSYYNNYSSRPLGEQSGGHKELEARDRVSLDETTALGRIRDFGAGDAASATDRAQPVTGRFGRYGADGVTLQEVLGERHGLWSFAARDQYG